MKTWLYFSFLTVYKNQLKKTKTLNALSSNHASISCSFVNNGTFVCGSGVWKFGHFWLFNTDVDKKLKSHWKI